MEIDSLDFFGYNADQLKVLNLLKEARADSKKPKKKLLLMTAPSFVVDFDYMHFVPKMRGLGFDKVTELTFGAKVVNEHYHKYIHEHYASYVRPQKGKGKTKVKDKNFQDKFISSVCPTSVNLIMTKYPTLKHSLLPFDSPMGAMSKIARKNFPDHTIIFLAPCSAKKLEAKTIIGKNKKPFIEAALTFAEMKQIVAKEKPAPPLKGKEPQLFDSFYNDYTKIYPLSGGLSKTLHAKSILLKKEIVSCDGCTDIIKLLQKNPHKVFYDILFCKGGCIGGPGIASHVPKFVRKRRVLNYRSKSDRESMHGMQGLDKYTKGLDFSKKF